VWVEIFDQGDINYGFKDDVEKLKNLRIIKTGYFFVSLMHKSLK